jgi:hypothetical protein
MTSDDTFSGVFSSDMPSSELVSFEMFSSDSAFSEIASLIFSDSTSSSA